jgi:hypothetical protein
MTFEDILPKLKEGLWATRAAWGDKDDAVYLAGRALIKETDMFTGLKSMGRKIKNWSPDFEDLTADDWSIIITEKNGVQR